MGLDNSIQIVFYNREGKEVANIDICYWRRDYYIQEILGAASSNLEEFKKGQKIKVGLKEIEDFKTSFKKLMSRSFWENNHRCELNWEYKDYFKQTLKYYFNLTRLSKLLRNEIQPQKFLKEIYYPLEHEEKKKKNKTIELLNKGSLTYEIKFINSF